MFMYNNKSLWSFCWMLMKYGYLIVRSLGAKLQEFPHTHPSASFADVENNSTLCVTINLPELSDSTIRI